MSKYIRIEDAIETAIRGCASWDGGYFPSMDEPIKEEFEAVDDKCIDLVRCRDCKHNKGEKVWWDGEVTIDCDNGMGYPPPDWFCADGERKEKTHE